MTEQMTADEVTEMTTEEVAKRLRVATGTLRYWRHLGEGPKSYTVGKRKVLDRRADVEAWLEAQYNAEEVAS